MSKSRRSSDFESRLNQALKMPPADPYLQSLTVLERIANDLEKWFRPGAKDSVFVKVEPGFQANIGQQFNINVYVPHLNARDTLFRAYIDIDGVVETWICSTTSLDAAKPRKRSSSRS